MAKRANKLKDLKMPKRPMAEEEVDMDLELEELGAGEELPEEEGLEEMPDMEEVAGNLDEYSDDELLDEMKKRGLMPDDEMPEEEDEEGEGEEEMLEEEELI